MMRSDASTDHGKGTTCEPMSSDCATTCPVASKRPQEKSRAYQIATEFRRRRIDNDNDYLLADNFARAIDTDGETILDARAGRAISATVQAAIESGRTGKPVAVETP